MADCQICGTRFGNRTCINCSKIICSSCVDRESMKCTKCHSNKEISKNLLRRNLPYIVLFVALWFFVSGLYPFPYFIVSGTPIDMNAMQPVFIATTIMTIPFIFLIFAWKKRS